MTLTLGKKIGGGFSLIILLVLIMGLVAIRAMNAGVQVSRNIAEDRVPRMVLFSKLQNNLLLGAYHTRVYFETSDESSYATGMEYLGELKRNFSNLEALHQANPSAETQNFLHRFSKELVAYTDDISAGREYRININKTTSRLIEVGYTVLGKTEAFARAMSEVQCDFLDQGNTAAVVRYAASEVGAAITSIQSSIEKSVRAVDNAAEQIAQTASLAHQSGKALEDIVHNAETAAEEVRAIAAASEQQSATSEEITLNISQVNSISSEVARAMGEATQAVANLARQAQNLSSLIDELKHTS